jgi:predicted phage baseplate assembly protein
MSERDCCTAAAPARDNAPGQPAIRFRTGDWATFRAAMVARLPTQPVPPDDPHGARPLTALTAREPTDPTIALIDAAASVLDVLTFYQERQLNEGYLGTATEHVSLVMMARALGYEPSPGVAAAGYLAFTTSLLATGTVVVPVGTPVMAMPEGSSPPPTFETTAPLEARREWNAIPVVRRHPVADLHTGDLELWVDGLDTRARPGDGVLLYGTDRAATPGSERWDFRRVIRAEPDTTHGETRLVFERPLGDPRTAPPPRATEALIFRNRASLFGYNAPDWLTQSDQTQLTAWWIAGGSMTGIPAEGTLGRTRLLSRTSGPIMEWPGFGLANDSATSTGHLDLDREYPGILPGSWVVLADSYNVEAYRVARTSQRSRVDFGLTAKVTRLELVGEHLARFDRRATTVWCEPDAFQMAGAPNLTALTGASIVVTGDYTGLLDRPVAVYGPAPDDDVPRGEVVRVTSATFSDGETTLVIDPPLANSYVRDLTIVNANLAPATHGQKAPPEVLGSGNAAQPFQRFVLKGRPLTHVSSPDDPRGTASALTVRVNGVAWTQVPYLLGQAPDARVYALKRGMDASTVVEFGDGATGARLPTGSENVVAEYRTGLGTVGEVAAGKASLLTRRPTGIDGAMNPAAFSGAADPEDATAIRTNAPRTVLTLDRLVSLQDYEDFARLFAGIGKVLAVGLWAGQRRLVHLTVGSATGQPLLATDPIVQALLLALRRYQDPVHHVSVDSFTDRWFGLSAALLVDSAYTWEGVDGAARTALSAAFAFATRQFGQSVTPAEVVGVLQAVPGVLAVDLDRIWRTDNPGIASPPRVLLEANGPQSSGGARQVAELLLVSSDPDAVQLRPMPE